MLDFDEHMEVVEAAEGLAVNLAIKSIGAAASLA